MNHKVGSNCRSSVFFFVIKSSAKILNLMLCAYVLLFHRRRTFVWQNFINSANTRFLVYWLTVLISQAPHKLSGKCSLQKLIVTHLIEKFATSHKPKALLQLSATWVKSNPSQAVLNIAFNVIVPVRRPWKT